MSDLYDEVDMVLNRPERFARLTAEQKRAHEERLAALLAVEDHSDDEEDPFRDGDNDEDADYVPVNDGEASDVEVDLEIEEQEEDDDDDLDEEEISNLRAEGIEAVVAIAPQRTQGDEFFASKDGTAWMKQPPPTGRPQAHNVPIATRAGPVSGFVLSPIAKFKAYMTPEMVDIICRETNRRAAAVIRAWNEAHAQSKPKVWTATNENELYAFIGLLLFSGLFNSNIRFQRKL